MAVNERSQHNDQKAAPRCVGIPQDTEYVLSTRLHFDAWHTSGIDSVAPT